MYIIFHIRKDYFYMYVIFYIYLLRSTWLPRFLVTYPSGGGGKNGGVGVPMALINGV